MPNPATVLGLSGGIVGQDADANRSGDLLTYDATAGLTRAIFSTGTNLNTATFGTLFHATAPQTLTRPVSVSGLKNSGSIGRFLSGGTISPGSGAGILKALTLAPAFGAGSFADPVPGAFAFEFTRLGAPVFGSAGASGNDVLRLTSAFTPFSGALTAANEINVYFGIGAGVRTGDTFLGGFYTDRNAAFTTSIASATYRYFVVDPLGDTTFNGITYAAFTLAPVEVSTVPQTADFGAGNVNGNIAQFRIVPEPAVPALLLAVGGALGVGRRRFPSGGVN